MENLGLALPRAVGGYTGLLTSGSVKWLPPLAPLQISEYFEMDIGLQLTDEDSGELVPSGGRDTSLLLQDLSLGPKPHDHIGGWRDITKKAGTVVGRWQQGCGNQSKPRWDSQPQQGSCPTGEWLP
ncbi:uncharacterized protein LOC119811834 isoform X7 [Arvicola amphibius]|uniref:uncharacterized protein LOC119811834 isoform X7 n=1 Tax=Arvicola amphibius TaxID=1047088 RepID=UPI001C098304|nr:uncharacterized protein LOC119811834 isoform X7 [Arvicola amphibius]